MYSIISLDALLVPVSDRVSSRKKPLLSERVQQKNLIVIHSTRDHLKIIGLGVVQNSPQRKDVSVVETRQIGAHGHQCYSCCRKVLMTAAVQRRDATPHPCPPNPSGSELLITAVALHKLVITPRVAQVRVGRYSSRPLATCVHRAPFRKNFDAHS